MPKLVKPRRRQPYVRHYHALTMHLSGPSTRKHESRGLHMTNPLHKLHAAQLEYTLNTEGWSGVDGYTDGYLSKIGRAVLVSCPTCEDELTIVAHVQSVPKFGRRLDREPMAPEPTPGVRYTDAQHRPVTCIELPTSIQRKVLETMSKVRLPDGRVLRACQGRNGFGEAH